jgi:hypothetical protein
MRTVVIIDDKDHALAQILHEFPPEHRDTFRFTHVDNIARFREAAVPPPFLVFLDFFLDHDQEYGTAVLPEIVCEHLICFSSMYEMSEYLAEAARASGRERIKRVYAVQKLKGQLDNSELRAVLRQVLPTAHDNWARPE